ncbi:MAG: phage GP46 family protein [Alphaproteobacteria bacterium]|nr:phage GP46 family protein [Alphaproteobacteria bacterium]
MTLGLMQNNDGLLDLATDEAGGLATGDELQAAILLSLMTNRRAEAAANLPDLGGWWADSFGVSITGSSLWLRDRAKPTDITKMQIGDDAKQSLEWLITDKIASNLAVNVDFVDINPNDPKSFTVKLGIVATRANGDIAKFDYFLGAENV